MTAYINGLAHHFGTPIFVGDGDGVGIGADERAVNHNRLRAVARTPLVLGYGRRDGFVLYCGKRSSGVAINSGDARNARRWRRCFELAYPVALN